MFVTVRSELHERWTNDKIPASDYTIEAEQLAKIGLRKEWLTEANETKKLPTGFYLGENITIAACMKALSEVSRLAGRSVSGVIHAGEDVHFYNLKNVYVPKPIPASLHESVLRALAQPQKPLQSVSGILGFLEGLSDSK